MNSVKKKYKSGYIVLPIPEKQNFIRRLFRLPPKRWVGIRGPDGNPIFFDKPLDWDATCEFAYKQCGTVWRRG